MTWRSALGRYRVLMVILVPAVAAAGVLWGRQVAQPDEEGRRPQRSAGAVLYGIGVSSDPYAISSPRGFGVLTGLPRGRVRVVEVAGRGLGSLGGPAWVGGSRILVPRSVPPLRGPLVFRLDGGRVRGLGPAPVGRLELEPMWSPDGRLIATEPIRVEKCPSGARGGLVCWNGGGDVYVARANGTARRRVGRGHLRGWTPDGRLVVVNTRWSEQTALDVATGRRAPIVARKAVARAAHVRRATIGRVAWSADGRFLAALADVAWPPGRKIAGTVVLARRNGRVIRLITSRYLISMLAWAPRGRRLAWTTSGFPDPHELFVLDRPRGAPRRVFVTRDRHFDWIAWSPGGRFLLVDDVNLSRPGHEPGAWRLLDADSGRTVRMLARPGGRPLWCCPVNSLATR